LRLPVAVHLEPCPEEEIMTEIHRETSLSPTELVVLACLSQGKEPSDDALSTEVFALCMPEESLARARAAVADAIDTLRGRALVIAETSHGSGAKKAKKVTRKNQVTPAGERALCAAFGLARKPTWAAVRDKHLPALGLGMQPGSDAATRAVGSATSIETAVLRGKLGLQNVTTIPGLCDLLIAEALEMAPGPVTLERIRVHLLARRAGVPGADGKLADVAATIAAGVVGAEPVDPPTTKQRKHALVRALGRRALRGASAEASPRSVGAQGAAPRASASERIDQPPVLRLIPTPSPPRPVAATQPTARDAAVQSPALPGENLLEVVREAIPQVGADGRFGPEKVFVSALWHRIEHGRRPADLSLDGFKRWLVTANRDGWLVLARADLVGAMDTRQVAESEIRDRGATFHFVLDAQRGTSSNGGVHVR
jgi:hypothetical protein